MDFVIKFKIVLDPHYKCFYFKGGNRKKIYFSNKEVLMALQGLNANQESELNSLLAQFPEVLTDKIGCTKVVDCKLHASNPPIAQKAYRVSHAKRELIKSHVQKMLQLNIRSSESEWASPVNLQRLFEARNVILNLNKIRRFKNELRARKSDPTVARIEPKHTFHRSFQSHSFNTQNTNHDNSSGAPSFASSSLHQQIHQLHNLKLKKIHRSTSQTLMFVNIAKILDIHFLNVAN